MANKPSDLFKSWIESQLSSKQPGEQFPTDRDLAKTWQLSERTIRRILQKYHYKGSIIRIPGKGTFMPGKTKAAPAHVPQSSVDNIVENMYQSICNGEIKRGESLPPVKSLCAQFKVAPTTVIRAYQELQRQGHVVKIGKTFWVGQFGRLIQSSTKKEIFLFCFNSYDFAQVFKDDMLSFAYQKMEKELSDYGYMILCESTSRLQRLFNQWRSQKKAPYGLIFYNINEKQFGKLQPVLNRFLKNPDQPGPSVVVDYASSFIKKSAGLSVISRNNISTIAARAVARHISETRYGEVIFCLDESIPYDQTKGYLWSFWTLLKIRSEIKHLNKDIKFRLVVRPISSRISKASYIQSEKKGIPPGNIKGILSKYRPTPFEQVADEIEICEDFKKSLRKHPSADLWAFSNHCQAALHYEWARKRGIRIPEQVSVLSLVNNPTYYHLGISFCETDWEGIGYLMAHSIIRDIPVQKTTKGFIKTRAFVREKLTTR